MLALACLLYAMDLTVLHLAVPSLSADLEPSSTQLLWIVDIYGFMVAGFLVTMGTLGDRIGRRRLLMIGGAAFAAVSVLAAFSTSPEMLIATRALQGIAGATLAPVDAVADLQHVPRPEAAHRSRSGVWIMGFSAGGAVGPVLGGVLLENFWWGSVFLMAVPVMALLLVLGPRLLPEYRAPDAGRLDLTSAALSLVAILAVIFGLKQIAQDGIGWLPAASMLAGLAIGVVFVRRQRALDDPMIDLDLFRIRSFNAALAVNMLGIFVAFGYFLFVAQYLQLVLGLSPLEAGLWSLPSALGFIVGSQVAPRLLRRFRPGVRDRRGAGDERRRPRDADPARRIARPHDARLGLGHHLARPGARVHGDDGSDRRIRSAGARGRGLRHLRDRGGARRRGRHRDPGKHRHRRLSQRARRSAAGGRAGRGRGGGPRHPRRRRRQRRSSCPRRWARRCSMPRARRSSRACA